MKSQRGLSIILVLFLIICLVGMIFLGMYLMRLDHIIREKFEGQRWDIPAKIYARPLELKKEAQVSEQDVLAELKLLNYKQGSADSRSSGIYYHKDGQLFIHTRGFDFGDRKIAEQILSLKFNGGQISEILTSKPDPTGRTYLEPMLIGGIYPQHNEDRVLLKLENTPQTLIDALISTEDRNFYNHHGVSIRGTARALWSNIRGGKRQGGSTLTQQLVKNFYLSSEKTYKRKVNEAFMAMLLELHYDKNEILETYLNEVNLGQNGNVSINGYGLASIFYFGRPLNELNIAQHAFLAGLVQGPTLYNPWKNPEGAKKRRDIVLKNMLLTGKISQTQYEQEIKRPLGILTKPILTSARFPDFMDIVRRQLRSQYMIQNLDNQGLNVFTTLNPVAQMRVEQSFKTSVKRLGANLQGATLVANPKTGEIIVAVGSAQDTEFAGFNRAIDAKRQVGSLLKPIIYLTALESERYNWGSLVDDSEIIIDAGTSREWKPKNYGGREYGEVTMVKALANSYNLSAVRVGQMFGVNHFINKLYSLGVPSSANIAPYPSAYLGAVDLTPMDMLAVYQTIANGGEKRTLTSIQRVVDQSGRIIENYQAKPTQVINQDHAYLLNYGLQQVVRSGTARTAQSLGANLNLAGKTGTTNDGRDAWFAGYSGNHVAVVWVGYDNNRVTGLTGGTGALPVWLSVMKQFRQQPVQFPSNNNIVWNWVDSHSGSLSAENCANAMYIPMLPHTAPQHMGECGRKETDSNPTDLDDIPEDYAVQLDQEQTPRSDSIEFNNQSIKKNSFGDDDSRGTAIVIPSE